MANGIVLLDVYDASRQGIVISSQVLPVRRDLHGVTVSHVEIVRGGDPVAFVGAGEA